LEEKLIYTETCYRLGKKPKLPQLNYESNWSANVATILCVYVHMLTMIMKSLRLWHYMFALHSYSNVRLT
jgi:hypothetical protein